MSKIIIPSPGEIYTYGEPIYIGSMPVRSEIEIDSDSKTQKIGYKIRYRRTYDEWVQEMHRCHNEMDVRRMIAHEATAHDFDDLRQVLEELYPNYLPIFETARIMK